MINSSTTDKPMTRFLEELHELHSNSYQMAYASVLDACRENAKRGWNFASIQVPSWEIAEGIIYSLKEEGIECNYDSEKRILKMKWEWSY